MCDKDCRHGTAFCDKGLQTGPSGTEIASVFPPDAHHVSLMHGGTQVRISFRYEELLALDTVLGKRPANEIFTDSAYQAVQAGLRLIREVGE